MGIIFIIIKLKNMNWNFQTFDEMPEMSGFDSVEALQNANPIHPDYILGLGNKQKKAEKKLKKAEKALEKGNVAKAEKKIAKAVKKGAKVSDDKRGNLVSDILATKDKVATAKDATGKFLDAVTPPKKVEDVQKLDPVTLQDSAQVQGNLAVPLGGGGGGDMGGGTSPEYSQQEQAAITTSGEPGEGGTMENVTVTTKPKNWLMLAAVAFVLIGLVIYLNRKK
jgi:hypothetical protein